MALRQFRIGSFPDALQYDDADYDAAIETDHFIKSTQAPVANEDMVRLGDLPAGAPGNLVTAGATIPDNALVRGDGGGRGIQQVPNVTADDNGQFTLAGNARIKHRIWIPANGIQAAGSKPASLVVVGVSVCWEFVMTSDKQVLIIFPIPMDVDRSHDMTVHIGWFSADNNVTHVANWELEYKLVEPDEDVTGAADGTLDASPNPSSTSNGMVLTSLGDITVGADDITLHANLILDVSDSTLSSSAFLSGICMDYVANKFGGAI
ncbi:MAG: hypothetical protein ACTSX2_03070 [Candidatus Thorarchaeota archaeon]